MLNKNKIMVYSLVLFMVLAMGLGSVSVAHAMPTESESLSIELGSDPLVIETFEDMLENIKETFLDIVPGLVFFLVLVIIGYIVAKLASWSITKILKTIGLEKAMTRVGVTKQVKKLGLK